MFLDTSAVISILTNEATKPALEGAIGDEAWAAPSSLPYELVNAFARARKQRRMTPAAASVVMNQFILRLPEIEIVPARFARSIEIAGLHSIHGYDAIVLAGAEVVADRLLTLDLPMRRVAPLLDIDVVEIGHEDVHA